MTAEPGRNDSCPCGSGRKYKHCCLKAAETAEFAWRQVRAAEGRLIADTFERAATEYGHGLLAAALDEFFIWGGGPEGFLETEAFATFFVPWFVLDFVADPHDPDFPADAPDEPLAAIYLRRHGSLLSPVERAFLESASASPVSFYAVTRTVPGREIALRDVLTGTDVVVREQSASQTAKVGGLIFTRIVTVGDVSIMVGAAPLLIPPSWHGTLIDVRTRLARRRGMLMPEQVREFSLELRELYFDIEDAVYNPPLPEIQNTDGDPLVLTTMTFALRCDESSAFERLKSLAGSDASSFDTEYDDRGAVRAVNIPWLKKGNRLHKDWEATTLGHLTIADGRLEVQVNSRRRARKIRRDIEKRLAGDAVHEQTIAEPVTELLAKASHEPRDPFDEIERERLEQHPEVQAMLQQSAEAHWNAWLDDKIPALANRSPRQAARTPEGRERLEALLAYYEWESDRSPASLRPDVPALRAKLGLPSP